MFTSNQQRRGLQVRSKVKLFIMPAWRRLTQNSFSHLGAHNVYYVKLNMQEPIRQTYPYLQSIIKYPVFSLSYWVLTFGDKIKLVFPFYPS